MQLREAHGLPCPAPSSPGTGGRVSTSASCHAARGLAPPPGSLLPQSCLHDRARHRNPRPGRRGRGLSAIYRAAGAPRPNRLPKAGGVDEQEGQRMTSCCHFCHWSFHCMSELSCGPQPRQISQKAWQVARLEGGPPSGSWAHPAALRAVGGGRVLGFFGRGTRSLSQAEPPELIFTIGPEMVTPPASRLTEAAAHLMVREEPASMTTVWPTLRGHLAAGIHGHLAGDPRLPVLAGGEVVAGIDPAGSRRPPSLVVTSASPLRQRILLP